MKDCCLKSFAAKGIREHFRLAEEGEAHTCERCGTVYALRGGQWTEMAVGAVSANIFSTSDDLIDFGWARGTRNRQTGRILIQCWGCGGAIDVPDRTFMEMHFEHADPSCSAVRAVLNKSKGVMPQVTRH